MLQRNDLLWHLTQSVFILVIRNLRINLYVAIELVMQEESMILNNAIFLSKKEIFL